MTSNLIARHSIVAGSPDALGFHKFHDPPREPLRTLDAASGPDVDIRLMMAETHELALPFALPGGARSLRMWSITDQSGRAHYPSPLIRVRQDQLVNATVITSRGPHTIHWHGIEPTPLNDGVGKHSFEIREQYTYQWVARAAGFYFYHCHRNTPLHFEMGLFGGLIVDPPQGEGWVPAYNPPHHVVPYDVEAVWVIGAHDSRWHGFEHDHALMPLMDPNAAASFSDGGIFNDWRPDVLTLGGAVAKNAATPITDARAAVEARTGETVLLRVLNASYAIAECRLGVDATIIAQDGRPLGVPPNGAYSAPVRIAANTPFRLNTAMRHDILVRPTKPGVIPFEVNYLDWRGYGSYGKALTTITVVSDPIEQDQPAPDPVTSTPTPRSTAPSAPTTSTPGPRAPAPSVPAKKKKPKLSLRERRRRARIAAHRKRAAKRAKARSGRTKTTRG